jgi:hypothetical protein
MTHLTPLALFGWVPISFLLFVFMPARRATVVALIGGWLLLPPYIIDLPALPDMTKNMSATLGILLGSLVFAPDRFLALRPRWFDLPMVAWCLCVIPTSLYNGLGWYDGISSFLEQFVAWGLPYLIGRLYFSDFDGLRQLAVGIAIGGLVYVLPCMFEMKMSPVLLETVYGSLPDRSHWMGTRLGGYRPTVFFWSGLELGMWMTVASLTAWWLWRNGLLKMIGPIPFVMLLPVLLGTTILCRSTGALILLAGGLTVLWTCYRYKTKWPLVLLVCVLPIYIGLRVPKLWTGLQVVNLARNWIDPERALSLRYRLVCEEVLTAKAMGRPVFGWGGWKRSSVYGGVDAETGEFSPAEDAQSGGVVPPDGMWIATFTSKGWVGLILLSLVLELPPILFLRHFSTKLWHHPQVKPALLAAVILGLYTVENLVNGQLNMLCVVLGGGLIGLRPARQSMNSRDQSEAGMVNGLDWPPLQKPTIARTSHPALVRTGRGTRALPGVSVSAIPKIRLTDRYRSTGRAYREQGLLAESQAAWQHAFGLLTELAATYPGDPAVAQRWCDCANDLAWLLLNHPDPTRRDPAAAIGLASQVVERCPECAAYWNTLGSAHYRAGDCQSAITALERAKLLGGGSTAFDNVFLAMAYAQHGQVDPARHHLDQATHWIEEHGPEHSELLRTCDEARALLASVGATSAVVDPRRGLSESDQRPAGSSPAFVTGG